MGTYNRLIKLYRHSNSVTPFEDFTTEILAGILEEHMDIRQLFISEILSLPGEEFDLRTQRTFPLNKDNAYRIDMVFENEDSICFLENKVESAEGHMQLENYSAVLDGLSKNKKTYLRYCSKYYDLKETQGHDFLQFRWADISRLLSRFLDRPQINDFYKFLKQHNMSDQLDITAKELFLFDNLKDTLSLLDDFLGRIKPAFISRFGNTNNADNSSQMRRFKRYIFFKKNVFGSKGYNEIGVGFSFKESPQVFLWIWSNMSNTKAEQFYEIINSSKAYDFEVKGYYHFSKNISTFLAHENPSAEIEKWFMEQFDQLQDFINNTPELEWKVEK